jgi:hypothetical protein
MKLWEEPANIKLNLIPEFNLNGNKMLDACVMHVLETICYRGCFLHGI